MSSGDWTRSRRCESAACVEVRVADDVIEIRDSKDLNGPALRFTRAEWEAFLLGALNGDFHFTALECTTINT